MVENDLNYDKMLQLFSMPPLLDQWKAIDENSKSTVHLVKNKNK